MFSYQYPMIYGVYILIFDKDTRKIIIQSLALIWGTTNTTLINAVQKLQNFAAKIIDHKAKKF